MNYTRWIILLTGLIAFFCVLLATQGCDGHHTNPTPPAVEFTTTPQGILSARLNGQELARAYYVIGSCTGADDPTQNVTSLGSNGRILFAPGACPGSPFQIAYSRTSEHILHAKLVIGPMATAYAALSVPFDLVQEKFKEYEFASGPVFGGCGAANDPELTLFGLYVSIPKPCSIPGHGPVGAAYTRKSVSWVEARGPFGHVRRQFYAGSSLTSVLAYNHPDSNNLEASFHSVAKGQVVTLEEDLTVY